MIPRRPAFSHLDGRGRARMVDVGAKPVTRREAVASGEIRMRADVARAISAGRVPKGDVLAVARIAGIMAAKRVPELIPLTHAIALESVSIAFKVGRDRVRITATARAEAKTGVEMEALTAACAAALAIYDMCKSADKAMVIGPVRLESKTGGASGDYRR